jgi:hypothetical protein
LPLVELANTTNSITGSTKNLIAVRAQKALSEYFRVFNLLLDGDALCGSKPARWRCRVFFTRGEDTP